MQQQIQKDILYGITIKSELNMEQDVLSLIQELKDTYTVGYHQGFNNIRVQSDLDDFDREVFQIVGDRLETDEEFLKRRAEIEKQEARKKAKEKKQHANRKDKEYDEYKRLKAKFER